MTVAPDYFLPAVFDLSHGNVQSIQTDAPGHARMIFDGTGIYIVDAAGTETSRLNLLGSGLSGVGDPVVDFMARNGSTSFVRSLLDALATGLSVATIEIFDAGGDRFATLLDAIGRASYLQINDPAANLPVRSRIIAGSVHGTTGVKTGGHGFTCSKLAGAGQYQLAYDTPLPNPPSMVVGTDQGSPIQAAWTGNQLAGPTITTSVGGVATNVFWNFIAIALW